jgi:RNA polymerase sigma-70 factor (ECF subfamily)
MKIFAFVRKTQTQGTVMIQLVIRAKDGDHEAFGELIEMYEDLVFTIVRRRVRDNFAVNDVTQDVFLRAFRKIGQLGDPAKFKSWICQIAVRLSINYAVRTKEFEGRDYFNPAGEEKDPAGGMIAEETAQQVRRAIKKLGRIYREAIVAFYFDELSIKEMGEKFKVPEGTAKRRLYQGRKMLHEALGVLV